MLLQNDQEIQRISALGRTVASGSSAKRSRGVAVDSTFFSFQLKPSQVQKLHGALHLSARQTLFHSLSTLKNLRRCARGCMLKSVSVARADRHANHLN